jgi:uncharacterized delta-60 repeat protein
MSIKKGLLTIAILGIATSTILAQSLPFDSSFGTSGTSILTSIPAYNPVDVTTQTDGKLLCMYGSNSHTYIFRTMPDGTLDNTFVGNPGFQLFPNVPGVLYLGGKVCVPEGSLIKQTTNEKVMVVFGGYSIMRLNANGLLDNTFGNSVPSAGFLDLNAGTPIQVIDFVYDFYESSSAYYFAGKGGVGSGGGTADAVVIAKTNKNGVLDATYGTGGIKVMPLDTVKFGFYNDVREIKFSNDGKILFTGSCQRRTFPDNMNDMFVGKFNLDGTSDNTFGAAGVQILNFNNLNEDPYCMSIATNGTIYVSGSNNGAGTREYYTTKLSATGAQDASYGVSGVVIKTPPASINSSPLSITTTSYGKLYLSMFYSVAFMVYKDEYHSYNADGSANTSFAAGGVLNPDGILNFNSYDKALKLYTQPDNKVIITATDGSHPKIMRITGDVPPTSVSYTEQTPKNTWVANGTAYINTGNSTEKIVAIVTSSDGRIVGKYDEMTPAQSKITTLSLPENIPAGMYILSVYQGGNVQQVKYTK